MNKHTPGPWKYGAELSSRTGEWLISFDAGNRGRGIGIAETRPGSGQEEANARLIAAAPDLLELLEFFLDFSANVHAGKTQNICYSKMDEARAAIAKAKGKTK